jgi:DNA-binding IclR family transcriptional regulator
MVSIRIDMTLTDENVLNILREMLGNQPGKLTLQQIAERARCSRTTAFRSIKRLENAGRVKSEYQGFSKPCIYQVTDD